MMTSVILREYRPGDARAMFALDCQCFEEPFRFSARAMRGFAEAQSAISLLALADEGVLAGFVIVHDEARQGARYGYVVTLDVAWAWRRRGLALQLLREAERRLAVRDIAQIALHVHTDNEAAVQFYERAGYTQAGLVPEFYGAGLDAFVYSKRL